MPLSLQSCNAMGFGVRPAETPVIPPRHDSGSSRTTTAPTIGLGSTQPLPQTGQPEGFLHEGFVLHGLS